MTTTWEAANPLHPQAIRRAVSMLGLPWDVMAFLQEVCTNGGMQMIWRVTNATLAKMYGRSPRTITRWVREARNLKLLSRYSNADGRAWTLRVHPRNVLKLRGVPVEASERELTPALPPKRVSPPPKQEPAGEPRQARRRRERLKTVASARLAWLWNTAPARMPGSRFVDPKDDCWPEELLTYSAHDQASIVHYFQELCRCGGRRMHPTAPSIRRFQKHWGDMPAFLNNEQLPQPRLGRELRPFALPSLDPHTYGDRADRLLAPAPVRQPLVEDLELKYIPQALQEAYLEGRWEDVWWDLVDQTGPPPDWLPKELRPRWGSLDLF